LRVALLDSEETACDGTPGFGERVEEELDGDVALQRVVESL